MRKIPRIYFIVRCLGLVFVTISRKIVWEAVRSFEETNGWLMTGGGNKKCNNFCLLLQGFWYEFFRSNSKSKICNFQSFPNATLEDKLKSLLELSVCNSLAYMSTLLNISISNQRMQLFNPFPREAKFPIKKLIHLLISAKYFQNFHLCIYEYKTSESFEY